MNEDRRNKFMQKKSKQFVLTLDIDTLNIFCSFAVSESQYIKRRDLAALNDLMNIVDIEESSANNIEKSIRYRFIKRALECRLTHGYTNIDVIFSYINEGIDQDNHIYKHSLRSLNEHEIQWVIESIFNLLKTYNIDSHINELHELCTNFKTSDYTKRTAVTSQIEDYIIGFRNELRKCSAEDSVDSMFSLRENVFNERIKQIHDELNDPYNKIKSGMQGLNQMINGGFQTGRVYCFLGLPGEGKSLLLLNLAYQIKKYNKSYTLKDPTKTPCVVFLTMENSEAETIDRLFGMTANVSLEDDCNLKDIVYKARNTGGLYISPENPIDIVVKFVPANSVTTDYLYTLYDDLVDRGYEPICLIQDYLKCIKTCDNAYRTDIRLELGAVVKEFKTFALTKNIPVITASQFNRDGVSNVDSSRKQNRCDNVNSLDRSNIGESMLILENLDATIFIVPEYDNKNRKYMGMKLMKKRFKGGNRSLLFQPFEENNEIRLIDDEDYAIPVFKESLNPHSTDSDLFNNGLAFATNEQPKTVELNSKTKFRSKQDINSILTPLINDTYNKSLELQNPILRLTEEEKYLIEKNKNNPEYLTELSKQHLFGNTN